MHGRKPALPQVGSGVGRGAGRRTERDSGRRAEREPGRAVGGEAVEVHLFRARDLRLAFLPETEDLFLVDAVGWDALDLRRRGLPEPAVGRELAARHGRAAAHRCLADLASVLDHLDGSPAAAGWGDADWLALSAGRPRLRALCLNVAHDCDLACSYCFAGRGGFGGARALMTASVARAAVDFLLEGSGDVQACEMDFFGGEPLLNLEVVRETVDYARRRAAAAGKRVGFTLTTNAAALGPDEAAYLNETMDNVILSLDGRPEVHDRMRRHPDGRPTHAAVRANVERFVALRGERDYWVRGTYTAFNLDFSEDVAYLAGLGFRNISLEPVVGGPVGPGRWGLGQAHLEALAAEYLRLADFLHDSARRGPTVHFFHFIADPEAGPCYAKRVRGCGAGREYLAVTPEGDVYPCHQFVGREGFRAGHVTEGLDATLVSGGLGLEGGAAEVAGLWVGAKEACRLCWARYRCSGGCHANAHAATGSLVKPDPVGCALQKARLEASLYLEARQRLSVNTA
ncbi:MAG: SPASM domain-containing protein [Bacillota bacterium]